MAVTEFPQRAAASPGGLRIRIPAETGRLVIFALWCCVTFVQFRGDELILYPLALYYAWAIVRDQTVILSMLVRSWVLLLFPVWCLLSPLWAVEPLAALKQAVYLLLTIMICYDVAATMRPRTILHSLLLAVGLIGIINALYAFATGDVKTGIFVQKNFMGKNMVILWVIAVSVFFDRGSPRWVRASAIGLAGIAALMAFLSESATAVLLVAATGGIILAGALFLLGGLMRLSRMAALCFCLAGTSLGAAAAVSTLQINPVDAVLDHFGKDSTLTGRTLLWTYAEEQIEERPLLGVGADGFWRYWKSPLVQKIHLEFHKGPNDKFNFHNSYYEIAVHQGLIGLGFAVIALVWAVFQITRGAIRFGTLPQVYFFAHSLAVLSRTITEADFLKPFSLFHMVLWIGALSALRLSQQASDRTVARQRRH